jgi:hypothetical protein
VKVVGEVKHHFPIEPALLAQDAKHGGDAIISASADKRLANILKLALNTPPRRQDQARPKDGTKNKR